MEFFSPIPPRVGPWNELQSVVAHESDAKMNCSRGQRKLSLYFWVWHAELAVTVPVTIPIPVHLLVEILGVMKEKRRLT